MTVKTLYLRKGQCVNSFDSTPLREGVSSFPFEVWTKTEDGFGSTRGGGCSRSDEIFSESYRLPPSRVSYIPLDVVHCVPKRGIDLVSFRVHRGNRLTTIVHPDVETEKFRL